MRVVCDVPISWRHAKMYVTLAPLSSGPFKLYAPAFGLACEPGTGVCRDSVWATAQTPGGAFAPPEKCFLRTSRLVPTVGDGINLRDGANAPSRRC